jgi:hypothetical protein
MNQNDGLVRDIKSIIVSFVMDCEIEEIPLSSIALSENNSFIIGPRETLFAHGAVYRIATKEEAVRGHLSIRIKGIISIQHIYNKLIVQATDHIRICDLSNRKVVVYPFDDILQITPGYKVIYILHSCSCVTVIQCHNTFQYSIRKHPDDLVDVVRSIVVQNKDLLYLTDLSRKKQEMIQYLPLDADRDRPWNNILEDEVASFVCDMYNMYVIKTDGSLWYRDKYPVITSIEPDSMNFMRIPIEGRVSEVTTQEGSIMIKKEDGSIWVRGSNHFGELGLGHRNPVSEFTRLDFSRPLVYIPLQKDL